MKTDDALKALEQCASGKGSCYGCPLDDEIGCRQKLIEYALETINRQKSEIVDEREKIEMCAAVIARQEKEKAVIAADRDELLQENNRLYKSINLTQQEQYTNGREYGIKEFAERLKKKACHLYVECDFQVVSTTDIDNLVKEMTEE